MTLVFLVDFDAVSFLSLIQLWSIFLKIIKLSVIPTSVHSASLLLEVLFGLSNLSACH